MPHHSLPISNTNKTGNARGSLMDNAVTAAYTGTIGPNADNDFEKKVKTNLRTPTLRKRFSANPSFSRRKSKQICEPQFCGKDTQTETVTTGTRLRPHTEASRFIIQRRKTSSSEGTSIRSTIESTMLMSCPTQHTQKMTIPDKPKDMMTWKIQKTPKATSSCSIKRKCALKTTTITFYTNSTEDFKPHGVALRRLQTSLLRDIRLITTQLDQKNATDDPKSTTWKRQLRAMTWATKLTKPNNPHLQNQTTHRRRQITKSASWALLCNSTRKTGCCMYSTRVRKFWPPRHWGNSKCIMGSGASTHPNSSSSRLSPRTPRLGV